MNKLAGAMVAVLLAAIVGAVLWFSLSGRAPIAPSPSAPIVPSPDPTESPGVDAVPSRPADAFAMTVLYVYDGDTIQAQHASGNEVVTTTNPIRIRLIGIDTPEGTPVVECGADEARAQLSALLPEGSTVWIGADAETWDPYDRRLFYLWTDDGRFVNYELVAAGAAEAVCIPPNDAHYPLLAAAQERAEASGSGQWGAC